MGLGVSAHIGQAVGDPAVMAARGLTSGLLAMALLLPGTAAAHRSAPEGPPVIVVPGGRLRLAQRGAQTIISGVVAGRRVSLLLPAEEDIAGRTLYAARFVGGLSGRVLILSLDYTSRPPGAPSAECGAGVETVLRIVALRPRLRQTFHQRVVSCWQGIDPGEITWNGATSTLVVERIVLSAATPDTPARYRIDSLGTVSPVKAEPSSRSP